MPAFDLSGTTVHLNSVGEVSLRYLTAGDHQNFFDVVARKEITDKEFVQDILFYQLITPKISKGQFRQILDED